MKVSYPFNCKCCGKLVHRGGGPKCHKKKMCTRKCDGIERDSGGYPINPDLRLKAKWAMALKRKANYLLKNLDSVETFYETKEWRSLRYLALKLSNGKCQSCKNGEDILHVDHIKPRSKYPELSLDINNLQVLCGPCNLGKGAWDETDWRK